MMDGGHVGEDHVGEVYVDYAAKIATESEVHRHSNHTQLGQALQHFDMMRQKADPPQNANDAVPVNPGAQREKLRAQINQRVRTLAKEVYEKDYARAYHQEIEIPFHRSLKVILNTWNLEQLRTVADRLEHRMMEVFRSHA